MRARTSFMQSVFRQSRVISIMEPSGGHDDDHDEGRNSLRRSRVDDILVVDDDAETYGGSSSSSSSYRDSDAAENNDEGDADALPGSHSWDELANTLGPQEGMIFDFLRLPKKFSRRFLKTQLLHVSLVSAAHFATLQMIYKRR